MSSTIQADKNLDSPSPRLKRVFDALNNRGFFKLIGGGSLTEPKQLAATAKAYAAAKADCIDISPDLSVIEAVSAALQGLSSQPTLMISIPLDPDPHFRKIDLKEADCIRCGACLPVCPTEAIALPNALEISQALCYGCGRCVPTCPTDALVLHPFLVETQLAQALAHPQVEAVEIHSHYVDPYMLETLFQQWGKLLSSKLISLCFRPENIPPEQVVQFYKVAQKACTLPVILQIDGAPMSGNDDPEASRPALEAAVHVSKTFQEAGIEAPFITVSGGINLHTAALLEEANYAFIAGVGMGTVARKAVWHLTSIEAEQAAHKMVTSFKLPFDDMSSRIQNTV